MVAAYLSAIVSGVVGAAFKDAVDRLDRLFLGILAIPAFAVEGGLGGGWAVTLGFLGGLVCYRTSSKPAEALAQS
jgi:hypothetical protein